MDKVKKRYLFRANGGNSTSGTCGFAFSFSMQAFRKPSDRMAAKRAAELISCREDQISDDDDAEDGDIEDLCFYVGDVMAADIEIELEAVEDIAHE
jgi:hypothetical protein